LEFEFEKSERQQMGVNGYSLLAPANDLYAQPSLPSVVNGKTNITAQSWSLPAIFNNTSGSIRFKKNLSDGWLWTTQYGGQRLRTDDRLAYAFGLDCRYPNYTLCDRFVAGPSFDIYDYRSENERRLTDSLQTMLNGRTEIAGIPHHLTFSVMRSRQLDRLQPTQLYSLAGTGTSYGGAVPAQTGGITQYNTDRSEYSNEVSFTDRVEVTTRTSIWGGLRYTNSDRSTVSLDNSNPNPINQQKGIATPWLAMSHEYASGSTVYASYGEGVELFAAPNNVNYTNAGQFLGVHRSKQVEVGGKGKANQNLSWNASVFHIDRPLAYDYFNDNDDSTNRIVDGKQTHVGLDAGLQWTQKQWLLSGQVQWFHARISGTSVDISLNGTQPINAPAITIRALAQYRWTKLPGLRTNLRLSHEGQRSAYKDGSINLPAWTKMDFAAHYETRIQGTRSELTLGIDNLMNKQYWRESPKQFGHYYLYPGAPRNLRLTVRTLF
jgi:iron complex outermembrane receptor protein